eukprot:RCo053901
MPPKKKEEVVVEAPVRMERYPRELREMVADTENGEQICVQIMEQVCEQAAELMVSNYFDRTAVPYTVQDVAADILHLVQLVFVARDEGDYAASSPAQDWEPCEEPPSVPADSWARGTVPTRRRVQDPPEPPKPASAAASNRGGILRRRTASAISMTSPASSPTAGGSAPAEPPPEGVSPDPASLAVPAMASKPKLKKVKAQTATVVSSRGAPPTSRTVASAHESLSVAQRKSIVAGDRDKAGSAGGTVATETEEQKLERMAQTLRKPAYRDLFVDTLKGTVQAVRLADPARLPPRALGVQAVVSEEP